MSALKFAAIGGTAQIYVDDVFSTYTYTGTGATQTITNGIDLAGKGGMVWCKDRGVAVGHGLMDTSRGVTKTLSTSDANNENTRTNAITSFNSNGFSLGADASTQFNQSGDSYVSWVFRNAPKFYTHSVVVKSAGSNATVDMSTLGTVGMVRVKRTDSAGSWYIWHRSLTAGKLLIGETTAAEATLGHITVSGTTVTLVNGVIADGTYLVEAWAHDTSAEGMIQCIGYTGNAEVITGWQSQYVVVKCISAVTPWVIADTSRGFIDAAAATGANTLEANTSSAEVAGGNNIYITTQGIKPTNANNVGYSAYSYVGMAIRRPNKPPTSGTQVYNAIARTGTGAAATVTGVGFAPDLVFSKARAGSNSPAYIDKLRGANDVIFSSATDAENTIKLDQVTAFGCDGVSMGVDAWFSCFNGNAATYINHFFRRAPGFFDEVCYTGTGTLGQTYSHNLGTAPEMMIVKCRSNAYDWAVYHKDVGNTKVLILNSTGVPSVAAGAWNNTTPTSSVFTVGNNNYVNFTTSYTYVAYLFATLAGISKVGSYIGNGTSLTVNCGFTTGARFVMIKRTDIGGDWQIWDTVRGIVAGNDPHLSLNTTIAEVTTDDSIDPDNTGFIVNQLAATNINVTSAVYLYLAIA